MAHADRLCAALALPEHFDRDRFDRISSTHALSLAPNRTARPISGQAIALQSFLPRGGLSDSAACSNSDRR
jgi:hypothetical protein